jgi:hypothetical protein
MDITTEFENGRDVECGYCFGSGIRTVPIGVADCDEDFCLCPAGQALAEREMQEDNKTQFDVATVAPLHHGHAAAGYMTLRFWFPKSVIIISYEARGTRLRFVIEARERMLWEYKR